MVKKCQKSSIAAADIQDRNRLSRFELGQDHRQEMAMRDPGPWKRISPRLRVGSGKGVDGVYIATEDGNRQDRSSCFEGSKLIETRPRRLDLSPFVNVRLLPPRMSVR
jgi:hypothetical protein